MKLLFVVNVDWFFISHRLPIAIEALKKGHEVHVACRNTGHFDYLSSIGIFTHDVGFSRSGSNLFLELNSLGKLLRLLKRIKPEIVHGVTIKPVLYTGIAVHFVRKKPKLVFAISGLGYVFSSNTLKSRFLRSVISRLYNIAFKHRNKAIIFQNSSDQQVVRSLVEVDDRQIFLIRGSGADLDCYSPSIECSSGPTKVLMAARLLREKGIYEYFKAATAIRKDRSDIEFILAGPLDLENPHGISRAELDKLLEFGTVNYIGKANDMVSLLRSVNIVVLPSYYGEGLPKVLIEAAACGRSVITTDNAGCRDAIIPDKTGLLVRVKSYQDLQRAISYLADNPIVRKQMGEAGRRFAETEFDVKSVVSKHMKIYEGLLSNEI